MNKADDLLSFLLEDLNGAQRDLVARSFYRYAEGDPDSAPVSEAVLLTACSRRLSQAPKELRESLAEFRRLLAEGREMELRIQQRVTASHTELITAFRDETARMASHLKATTQNSEGMATASRQMAGTMQSFVAQGGKLLTQLQGMSGHLRAHDESSRNIAEATRTNLYVSESNQSVISTLTKMACVNWISVGVLIGFVLSLIVWHLPWWLGLFLFALAVGFIHWLAHAAWRALEEKFPSHFSTRRRS